MFNISEKTVECLRKEYHIGARVELLHMDAPYNTKLFSGVKCTMNGIDVWAPFMS